MPWRLLVVDGADQGRSFPLTPNLTIGNGQGAADICLNDLYVARLHCQIGAAGDGFTVTALPHSKVTFINGQKVTSADLRPGDVLRVGNSHLRLEAAEPKSADPGVTPPTPPAPAPGKLSPLPPERLGELTGHRLGHYEVGPLLGRGHCGVVFRAHDLKDDHPVALKILAPDFPHCEPEMQTFVRAMKAVLPLRHPHLVAFLGVGKSGPYCWIALELVEGESLAQVIERGGKRSWKQALRVAVHVARGLDFAHRHHLLHGNITPANLLVRAADKVTKVGDLALPRALEGSRLQLATLESKLLAELPYLAPEQTPGEGTVDICTDLHGLGAVVYALLTGRPPFLGDAPEETLRQIREALPARPRDFHETIPVPFEVAVLKLLAKHPEDRFLTPAELLTELEPLAQEHGVKV